ncbi:hypothetical protein [Desulfuromonas sp. AOP6]|uniref:hypothetical protein n=1 Tax=Desulfuromonas sp. AOP6 TaxID=1566351 RepID=UPI00128A52E7|nr:hypothetical protein [Desulfuromonas sp. AOP6]BCA80310.1 hypothetical protein AOP6_2097 [Desulfuromonas sp. AOP6]
MEYMVWKIEDGTIDNPLDLLDTRYSVQSRKRWGALVWKDKSIQGGLDRSFLAKRDGGGILVVKDAVKAGDYLEMGTKIVAYSKRGNDKEVAFYKVIKMDDHEMTVLEVDKGDIPGKDDQLPPTEDEQQQAFNAVANRVNELEKELEDFKGHIKSFKNIFNRATRRTKEGKMTLDCWAEELNNMKKIFDQVPFYQRTVKDE